MLKFSIGLTGGIGCGKTTVSNLFKDLGVDIIDADVISREIVAPGTAALSKISSHFGHHFLTEEGQLNREKLRSEIFSNDKSRLWLNQLMHPIIRATITAKIADSSSDYCILSAPLLIENKLDLLTNRVLVIDICEEQQLKRTLKRDTSSEAEIKRIIANQIPRAERLAVADDIIDNSSSNLEDLDKRVLELDRFYKTLLSEI